MVDATGDADVAYMAGALCKMHTSNSSYCFRIGNVNVDKFVQYFCDPDIFISNMDINWTYKEALAYYRATGTFLFPHGGTVEMEIQHIGDDAPDERQVQKAGTPQLYWLVYCSASKDNPEWASNRIENV